MNALMLSLRPCHCPGFALKCICFGLTGIFAYAQELLAASQAPPSPALGSLGSSLGSEAQRPSRSLHCRGPLCAFAAPSVSGTETSETASTASGSLASAFLASRFCLQACCTLAAARCADPCQQPLLPRSGVRAVAVLWMLALPPPLSQTPVPARISCPTHSALDAGRLQARS